MATVTLYHFTSAEHIGRILEARELRTTESNISFKREHAGPAVVWLTTHTDASAGLGLTSPHVEVVDKSEVRVTVEIDKRNAHKWREWARRHGSSPETIQRIAETGGGASIVARDHPPHPDHSMARNPEHAHRPDHSRRRGRPAERARRSAVGDHQQHW